MVTRSLAPAVVIALMLMTRNACGQQTAHPLAPPDTSSPRATLQSLLDLTNEGYQLAQRKGRGREMRAERSRIVERMLRCLDMSEVPEFLHDDTG